MEGIIGKLQIGLLDGKNWDTWKYKALCLLRTVPSALEVVEGSFQEPTRPPTGCGDAELAAYQQQKDKFDKADASAILILTTNMHEDTLRKVMRFTNAHDVWLELHRLFDGTNEDRTYNLCMSFFSFKKDQADDIATHMSKLKNIWTELNQELKKDSNQELPELLLVCKILDTLDDSYFSFRSSWLLLPKSNRTVENLTSHLCAFERALQAKNSQEHTVAKRHIDHSYCITEEPATKCAKYVESNINIMGHMPVIETPGVVGLSAEVFMPTCSNAGQKDTLCTTDEADTTPSVLKIQKLNSPERDVTAINKNITIHTPKSSKKRILSKIQSLTPRCSTIYRAYIKAKKQANFMKRARSAINYRNKNSLEKAMENMNPYAKKILNMQINLYTKEKKGRRFSDTEKLIALEIMKQSPKCYRFLQKIFILPSKTTINKLITGMNIGVGINKVLVEVMKKEVASWDSKKKFCSIMFDEMHIQAALHYNRKNDEITGFVHLDEKKKDFANQALVFILRGAIFKWEQPLAFYFCQGTTSPTVLKRLLKTVVATAIDIGLTPVATICDQGSSFRRALQDLQHETRREQLLADLPTDDTMTIEGMKLSVIYDPSHLIKGLRNNFLNKSLEINGEKSQWQDIVDVYLTDCHNADTRLLHKLNDEHVIPEKMKNRKKMKVSAAARVFSATVSAALSYTAQFSHYIDGRAVSPTIKNTAKTVRFFDNLFDSMNGLNVHHRKTKGKALRKAVTKDSDHHQFWKEAITTLENIKFLDKDGNVVAVPTLKSCITTIKSLMRLWQYFQDLGLKVMRPRYFNSDPIENFFGQVRAYNFRHPDCHSFMNAYKSLLITQFVCCHDFHPHHQHNYLSEDDQADPIINLAQIYYWVSSKKGQQISNNKKDQDADIGSQLDHPQKGNDVDDEDDNHDNIQIAREERLKIHTYTAGWAVRKFLQKTPCDDCKKKLTTQDTQDFHKWISHREFNQLRKFHCYPSEMAVRCFGEVLNFTTIFLNTTPYIKTIAKQIQKSFQDKYDFELTCPKHQNGLYLRIIINYAINNFNNIINKALKGVDNTRLKKRVPVILRAMTKSMREPEISL